MIKVKVFDFRECEAANSFMEKNPPRSTETQSGMFWSDNNIVIIYEDGTTNTNHKKAWITNALEKTHRMLWLSESKLAAAELVFNTLAPHGYNMNMSEDDLRKCIKAVNGLLTKKEIDTVFDGVTNAENEMRLHKHEVKRLNVEVEAYQKMLNELN